MIVGNDALNKGDIMKDLKLLIEALTTATVLSYIIVALCIFANGINEPKGFFSKCDTTKNPTRIMKYTGLNEVRKLGCWLGSQE